MTPNRAQSAWLLVAAVVTGSLWVVAAPLGVMAAVLFAAAAVSSLASVVLEARGPLAGWLGGSLLRLPIAFALGFHYRDETTAIAVLPLLYLAACLLAVATTPRVGNASPPGGQPRPPKPLNCTSSSASGPVATLG